MYRKLKNILGVSLMALAIVMSQIPMPETQAETAKEMTEQDMQSDDVSTHTVTFSMNGGKFDGSYNGYRFEDKTPVLVLDDGDVVDSFPEDKFASYPGYKTENSKWYVDKECLTEYDKEDGVKKSITLYKKWYNVTSDGNTLAEKGFHISADGTVLYQYDGDEKNVVIPQTVTTIAKGAFGNFEQVRGITLPSAIRNIEKDTFSGVRDVNTIVYIYDSDNTESKELAKKVADEYEQLVYSEYLDAENTEKIVGIDYESNVSEENAEVKEGSETETGTGSTEKSETETSRTEESNTEQNKSEENKSEESKSEENSSSVIVVEPESSESGKSESEESKSEENKTEEGKPEEPATEESKPMGSEPEESKPVESEPEESKPAESKPEESSTVIVIEPDEKYTVTFDTGIAGVNGEKREVLSKRTTSELVSIDDSQPQILRKDVYQIEKDDGKQEITYVFKGWYKDKEFTKEWDFSSDVIEGDTIIYAKWDKQTRAYYFVTYDTAEGGDGAANIPDKQKLYEDENLEKPSKNPSLKNKVFKGWYTDAEDTSTEYKSWGKPITKDMTLYARFDEKTNTVVFHMNGGGYTGSYQGTSYTAAASLKTAITVGKGIASSDYPENSTGASFKYSNYTTDSNWYKDKECLTVYSQNGAALTGDLTLYKKWYYTSSGFTMNTSSNVLYKYSGSVETITIPNSVTTIGTDAFASVGGISNIVLPDNIAEVKENAFSGVDKISKDISISGKTKKAQDMAKNLAKQYKHLVYNDDSAEADTAAVVSTKETGGIQLGATIGGSAGTTKSTTSSTAANNTTEQKSSITLGASSVQAAATTGTAAAQPGASAAQVTQGTPAAQDSSTQNVQSSQGSSTAVKQGTKTTAKQNITSASAPRGTEHIKDSTPKTGDPLQYRMLIVCVLFSVGALLVLTGNGKKKKFSAS